MKKESPPLPNSLLASCFRVSALLCAFGVIAGLILMIQPNANVKDLALLAVILLLTFFFCMGAAQSAQHLALIAKTAPQQLHDNLELLQELRSLRTDFSRLADSRKSTDANAHAEIIAALAALRPITPPPLPAMTHQPERKEAVYFFQSGGTAAGPYTAEEILRFCRAGIVTETTPVCRADEQQWMPFSEMVDRHADT